MSEEGASAASAANTTVLRGEWLCGQGEDFWNSSASWNSPRPAVGACFQAALWTFPPALVFWLFLPLSVWSSVVVSARRRREPVFPRWSLLVLAKLVVTAGLVAVAAWDLACGHQVRNVAAALLCNPSRSST